MNASAPLTEHEVEQLILTFWKMQEEKAHLVELMEVTTPDIEFSMGDIRLARLQGARGPSDGLQGAVSIIEDGVGVGLFVPV